ncbi:hypothetical protein HDU93_004096, partial [Gonapodya sp. JEL0774]
MAFVAVGVGVLGSPARDAIVVATGVFLSSTAVVLKFLTGDEAETRYGRAIVGILVVQDVMLGLVLAIMPALARPAGVDLAAAVFRTMFSTALFVGASVGMAWLPVTRWMASASIKIGGRELLLVGSVSMCWAAMKVAAWMGLSSELGSFAAGVVVASCQGVIDVGENAGHGVQGGENGKLTVGEITLHAIEPLRDFFSCIFFSAVGLHGVSPQFLLDQAYVLAALAISAVAFKMVVAAVVVKVGFGYKWRESVAVGVGLSNISEFTFVVASRAKSAQLISREVFYVLLGTTSLSMVISPLLWWFIGFVGIRDRSKTGYRSLRQTDSTTLPSEGPEDADIDGFGKRMYKPVPARRENLSAGAGIVGSFWTRPAQMFARNNWRSWRGMGEAPPHVERHGVSEPAGTYTAVTFEDTHRRHSTSPVNGKTEFRGGSNDLHAVDTVQLQFPESHSHGI